MAGVGDLVELSRLLDPVTTVLVGVAILVYIRRVIQPRLNDVEDTQEDRGDQLQDHRLNNQEQTLLIDDNAERVDQVEDAVGRLKERVRRLEQSFAAEHNRPPRSFTRGSPEGNGQDRDVQPDDVVDDQADHDTDSDEPSAQSDGDPGTDGDDGDIDDQFSAATRRLHDRVERIRRGIPSSDPRQRRPTHAPRGDD